MIPLRDTIRSKNYPVINWLIIATNVLVYLIELAQGERLGSFIITYGLVPARYSVPQLADHFGFSQQAFSLFSFMFLHGGFWHLLGNMWSLYIFGDNVEDRLGPFRYLVFYLLCGIASGLSHLFLNWHASTPTIGASGAIAGVMGAYFILYPRAKILTLIPIFFLPYFIEIPAFVFIGIWFLFQFLSAAGTSTQTTGVAWWAHIGGFVFGMIFLWLFLRIPGSGLSEIFRTKTERRRTPHLQVIRTLRSAEDPNLYGTITISPTEARSGTLKLVNIPWGFQKRVFKVNVPAGVAEGTTLRLAGMGRQVSERRGDLYLKVNIREMQ
jgi:membrane associated rhomboid family serine protease